MLICLLVNNPEKKGVTYNQISNQTNKQTFETASSTLGPVLPFAQWRRPGNRQARPILSCSLNGQQKGRYFEFRFLELAGTG